MSGEDTWGQYDDEDCCPLCGRLLGTSNGEPSCNDHGPVSDMIDTIIGVTPVTESMVADERGDLFPVFTTPGGITMAFDHDPTCPNCDCMLDEQGLCPECQPASSDPHPRPFVTQVQYATPPTQTIYFDPDDHDSDGAGWNVVEGDVDASAIAIRFATFIEAADWCEHQGLDYEVRGAVQSDNAFTRWTMAPLWDSAVRAMNNLTMALNEHDPEWRTHQGLGDTKGVVIGQVIDADYKLNDARGAWDRMLGGE